MKQNQKSQQVKNTKTGKKQFHGKEGINSSQNIRKNDDVSSGDTQEEPPNPTTPATPTTPRREYEDPGHEHDHQFPTDIPFSPESVKGLLRE